MSEGITVSPGTETKITLTQTNRSFLGTPYTDCTDQRLLDPRGKDDTYIYSVNGCFSLCEQQIVVDECSCLNSHYAHTKDQVNLPYCYNTSRFESHSLKDIVQMMNCTQSKSSVDIASMCDTCENRCNKIEYGVNMAKSSWPDKTYQLAFYSKYIKPNPKLYNLSEYTLHERAYQDLQNGSVSQSLLTQIYTENLIGKRFLFVIVEFDYAMVELLGETASITWDTLASNIGGSLSLWLGITVMTIAEFMELICRMITLHEEKRQKAAMDQNQQKKTEEPQTDVKTVTETFI